MSGLPPDTEAVLYPALAPRRQQMLPVSDGHSLYYEESGHPGGVPVVCLHGGPGSGSNETLRRFFDPQHMRIIVYDQRGAGRSQPTGSLRANTTAALVQDLEALRQHLGIERWLVFGGSWGATLALCYASAFPARVLGLVLRAPLLGRRRDLDWFFGPDGVARIYPREYRAFLDALPAPLREQSLQGYAELFRDGREDEKDALARAWSAWDHRVTLGRRRDPDASVNVASCAIAAHYAAHGFFLPDDGVLPDLNGLAGIPTVVVQGERDLVCPAEGAVTLARHCAHLDLHLFPDTGHIAMEPAMARALVRETEALVRALR